MRGMWALLATAALLLGGGTQSAGRGFRQHYGSGAGCLRLGHDALLRVRRARWRSACLQGLTRAGAAHAQRGQHPHDRARPRQPHARLHPRASTNYDPLPSNYDDWIFCGATRSTARRCSRSSTASTTAWTTRASAASSSSCRFNTITLPARPTAVPVTAAGPRAAGCRPSLPLRAGGGPLGFFTPSNIVEKDGFFYNMILASRATGSRRAARA